jgi:glutamyl-tRNA synthetase
MERLAVYKEHAERLIREKKAYRCHCTKEELDAQRAALKVRDPKAQFKYPGTCRSRTDQPDLPYVVRFRAPETGSVRYVDKVFGEVTTPNAAQQDFVLVRSDGVPLYNFGAVVDDMTMDITLVARGRDHMINTPPQILLYEAFGRPAPAFAHLPMMLAQSGEKLSKRHGAVSVGEYRDLGYAPQAVLNYLARFGWSHGDQEVFSIDELVAAFDWEGCNRSDGKFDPKKFLTIDEEHLKSERLIPTGEYVERLLPFLVKQGLSGLSPGRVAEAVPLVRTRAKTFADAAQRLDFVFREKLDLTGPPATKYLVAASAATLRSNAAVLSTVSHWTTESVKAATEAWLKQSNLELKNVAQPLRVALTGSDASPGLYEVEAVLGKDETLARLRDAADEAEKRG